jgi:hypothetical protein
MNSFFPPEPPSMTPAFAHASPARLAACSAPSPDALEHRSCEAMNDSARLLELACKALWSATLSLMTAYMQTAAPAHRLLLARRIAANFDALSQQDSFSRNSREAFCRLQHRWQHTAERLAAATHESEGGRGLLERLLPFGPQRL